MMRILHLEDNDTDAELICDALRAADAGSEITRVDTRQAFREAIDHGGWDIILADYSLPGFDGNSALKLAVERHPEIPFIFVTGYLGEEKAVETLRNGATDYILKDRLNRLPQAVVRAKRESESARDKEIAYQKLKDALRDKSVLLQEVHHRVNNNLQIICSLLSMQSVAASDSSLTNALQASLNRVRSMATIHRMLCANTGPGGIDFGDYARLLAREVLSSYGTDQTRVRIDFDVEPVYLEIDSAIPCGLILNELLSNGLKYAFPDGRPGIILISLKQSEGCMRLTVEDNGVGLPATGAARRPTSLGLNIVEILRGQLRASMEITSRPGARFALQFAL
jgi:two-component sensor histidine kinase